MIVLACSYKRTTVAGDPPEVGDRIAVGIRKVREYRVAHRDSFRSTSRSTYRVGNVAANVKEEGIRKIEFQPVPDARRSGHDALLRAFIAQGGAKIGRVPSAL